MDPSGPLYWLTFTQFLMTALIIHVSIGVYGSFYLVRSLAFHHPDTGKSDLHFLRKTDDGSLTKDQMTAPRSARELPFPGLLTCAFLGVIGVVLWLIIIFLSRWLPRLRTGLFYFLFFDGSSSWYR